MDSRSNSIKILIIAEDQMNRFRLKRELYDAHYDVIVAENEEEGFQLATRIMPDVILFDWTTSPRSCSLLYEQLKNDPIMRCIPVIFLADRDNAAMMEAGLGLGTIDYVLRPFKLEELQACIRKVRGVRDEQRRLREEILQVKSNIMSMLEYKLRFPVTVIAGLAELINQQISHSNSWTQPDYVNGIIRQADHLK
ncbi:MAG: response regulator, partial [Nitrospiria bacterium]